MSAQMFPVPAITLESKSHPIIGLVGVLEMVELSRMVIDYNYQRSMTLGSVKTARRIARDFDWRKFTPVIGVRVANNLIAIVDGQHRASAAKARGIQAAPTYILDATLQEAAAAFAAINGNVTPMNAQDIYRAKLVGGDPEALALQAVLDVAGVSVISGKVASLKGQTRSVGVLQRCLRVYGSDMLTLALQCITETGDGNVGLIIGSVVNGIIEAILKKSDLLATPTTLLDLFDGIDLRRMLRDAEVEFAQTKYPVQDVMRREIHRVLAQGRVKS